MPEATTSSFDRAPGESPLPGTAFDWVPTTTYEAKHFVRPSTAELPVRAPESTPLDLFDDPELETKSPSEWLHSTTDAKRRSNKLARERGVEVLQGARAVHVGALLRDRVR